MATAVEQFVEAMNKSSKYWKKAIEVTARDGKIEIVHCDGHTWSSDPEREEVK